MTRRRLRRPRLAAAQNDRQPHFARRESLL